MLFRSEGHAAIDDDPLSSPILAEAVDREIHPDLADSAEGCKYEFALRHKSLARPDQSAPAHGEREHIAGRYFGQSAVGALQHQATLVIETNEAALHFGITIAHCDRLANAAGMAQPIAENSREVAAVLPLRQAKAHRSRYPRK